MHDSHLQQKMVPSASGTLNSNENSILSEASSTPEREQPAMSTSTDSSKTVLSGPSKAKPPGTFKSLVSDTATRSQPSREAKKTRFHDNPVSSIKAIPARTVKTKHPSTRNRRSPRFDVTDPDLLIPLQQAVTAGIPDQGGAQPSFPPQCASLPASQQPSSSETTTKEPSVVLPVSPDAGTKTASESSSSSSESSSGTSSSEASSTSTSPSTGTMSSSSSASTSPEMCGEIPRVSSKPRT